MFLKLAWRNLWRNRKRTLITASSIVFAVLLSIVLNSLKEGIMTKMQENIVSFYSGAIQVHKAGYWDDQSINNSFALTDSLMSLLKSDNSIDQAIPRLESFALSASEEKSRGSLVVGIDPGTESSITRINEKLSDGQFLDPDDKAVLLTKGISEYLKIGVGDTLVIIGQGYHGASAAGKYPIKGILDFASPQLNKSLVYIPIKEAQWLFNAPDQVTALVINTDDIDGAPILADAIQKSIGNAYESMSWKVLLPELDQMIEGEKAETLIFLFVLYMLISFGIFGTILMMTMERKYEFGVLVAIGMKKLKLSSVVIMENIFISLVGAIAGTIISVPVVGYFNTYPIQITGELKEAYENYGFEPVFYFSVEPEIFYSQTIVILIIALVLSVFPLVKINQLNPVEAMRD